MCHSGNRVANRQSDNESIRWGEYHQVVSRQFRAFSWPPLTRRSSSLRSPVIKGATIPPMRISPKVDVLPPDINASDWIYRDAGRALSIHRRQN